MHVFINLSVLIYTSILILYCIILLIDTGMGINARTRLSLSNRCLERTLDGTAELEHLSSPGSS